MCLVIQFYFGFISVTFVSLYTAVFFVLKLLKTKWIHDVRGSVHHSTIHTEKSNKMQQCIKIYYSIFIWSSTCFGRHTAHHQELKTALAACGFAYVEGCWWLLDAVSVQQPHVQQPSTYAKPEAASAVLGSWWWAVCRPKRVELYVNIE